MPMTPEHKGMIREHFKHELGGKCMNCGTGFNLEFHHIKPVCEGEGRGSEKRIWELFDAYHKCNLLLFCKSCHIEHHKEAEK